ncbi:MAG TPA: hypothetical protein VN224_12725 [Xanthomonadales bacterium]|nr:hypothetical protein [Xanthomonadales bacterium]
MEIDAIVMTSSRASLRGIALASIVGFVTACGGGATSAPPQTLQVATPAPPTNAFVVESVPGSGGTASDVVAAIPLAGGTGYTLTPLAGQLTVGAAPASNDSLYVEHRVNSTDEIEVYRAGSTVPTSTFAVASHLGPVRFAVDRNGRLYMPGGSRNVIDVYDVSSGAHVASLAPGVNDPVCIAVQADGTMFVGGHNPNAVAVVPLGATTPSRVIAALDGPPRALAVDDVGTLYVADGFPAQGDVQVFAPGAAAAAYGLTVNGPSGVAVDASGTLYVATADNTIAIYAAGATAPSRTLPLAGVPGSITI